MFGMPINRYGDASVFEASKELSTPSVSANDVLIKLNPVLLTPLT